MVLSPAPPPLEITRHWDAPFEDMTSLEIATFYNDANRVALLIKEGADPDEKIKNNPNFNSVLEMACILGFPEVVASLLAHGADPNKETSVNDTNPLGVICNLAGEDNEPLYQEHIECAQLLIAHGASVNFKNKSGETPLMLSANLDNVECARFLLAQTGINVNEQDDTGWTALDWSFYLATELEDLNAGNELRQLLYKAGCSTKKYDPRDPLWVDK